MLELTEKEKAIIRIAVSYAKSNLDDINEVFEVEGNPDLIEYDGLRFKRIQYDEMWAVLGKLKNI